MMKLELQLAICTSLPDPTLNEPVTESAERESAPCTLKLAAMASAPVPTRNSDARRGTVIVVAAAARSAGMLLPPDRPKWKAPTAFAVTPRKMTGSRSVHGFAG